MKNYECITNQNKRDKKSHILKYSCESNHSLVWKRRFQILNSDYRSNIKRKISEALYLRTIKPTLDVKENSYFYKGLIFLLNMLTLFHFGMTFYCNIIILDNLYFIRYILELVMLNGF